jgi:hypothetical protein
MKRYMLKITDWVKRCAPANAVKMVVRKKGEYIKVNELREAILSCPPGTPESFLKALNIEK